MANLRILGVSIDDEITFSDHVSDICKTASKKVGVLARVRNRIPCKTKLQLYLTAILPHLTYCQIVWHFCKKSDRRKLERIKVRALRIIFNNKTNTYEDLLGRAELSSLYNRWLQDIAILMNKDSNGLAPEHIAELFTTANKGYTLRDADYDVRRYTTVS